MEYPSEVSTEPRDLFADYVDDELPAEARAALEEALADDPSLRDELVEYRDVVKALGDLPRERAPDRFLLLVQQRIRRRSRGRYFDFQRPRTLVFEGAVCAVLIFVMAALYLFAAPPTELPEKVEVVERVSLAPADARFLREFATVETVGTDVTGSDLVVRLAVPAGREAALLAALAAHPRMEIVPTSAHRQKGVVRMVVRARPGPRSVEL